MRPCDGSFATGETVSGNVATVRYRPCLNEGHRVRFRAIDSGWGVTVHLCDAHAELWDLVTSEIVPAGATR